MEMIKYKKEQSYYNVIKKKEQKIMEYNHEVIVPNEDLPFKLFLFEGEKGNYFRDRHWHRSIEIFAVFEGSLTFSLLGMDQELKPGDFMLVNSNEIHSVDSPLPNQTVVVQIPLQTFADYFTEEQYIRFTHDPKVHDAQVMKLIKEMYTAYTEKNIGYELTVKSGYYKLLYLLVTKYRETEVSGDMVKQNKKLNRLTAITNYIKENYREELSLEALAGIFGYAPSYLSRMFRKYAEINYKDYVQSVRVEYAFQELTGTEHTVSEIAENNGFPNNKAFVKAFHKKYGMLPSEYRKYISR